MSNPIPVECIPVCSRCHTVMKPVWYTEYEEMVECGHWYRTGRSKRALSHFECPYCFRKECVDDSFDDRLYR